MSAAVVVARPTPLPDPTRRHDDSNDSDDSDDDDASPSPPFAVASTSTSSTSSSESTYASLIRTYLNLLCHDNATFLAERNAASHPWSENAIYLLAHCHYRGGSPSRARSVILNRWPWAGGGAGGGGGGGVAKDDDASSSSSSSSTAAAARTNRRIRAMDYHRRALRLDPLMWTSYEALCELGGPTSAAAGAGAGGVGGGGGGGGGPSSSSSSSASSSSSHDGLGGADDPEAIFGVPVPTTMNDPGKKTTTTTKTTTTMQVERTQQQRRSDDRDDRHRTDRYGTPSTPYDGLGRMNVLGTDDSRAAPPATSNYYNLPPPTTASTARGGGDGGGGGGDGGTADDDGMPPRANLFATTPALSYASVDRRRGDDGRRRHPAAAWDRPGRGGGGGATVAWGSTPTSAPPTMRGEIGGGDRDRDRDDDNDAPSVRVEKRALFSPNDREDDTGGGDGGDGLRKKSQRKEGTRGGGTTRTTMNRAEGPGVAPTTTRAARPGFDEEMTTEAEHVREVLELLCCLGAGYKFLCQYRSRDALVLFRTLPIEQINTGWVQHQIGKAYFEMSDYQNAHRALQIMRRVEPHRIKGLDILSTALWQLKKEVELSDLAQQAVAFDRMAPEAWFVVGNCFSLQKEHETAITFFRRSIQLNPLYTYAHTLCGHEFTSNEDFEKAISCYRDAIRVDSRHYNAWYGLGAIYFRQEKFDLAEYHFKRALDINSQSSVLHCHLGMAQHQNGKTIEALETLSGAFRLDPRNPQAHYQRATIFMSLDRPEDALLELEKVRSAAPKESSVHFNMGKVYKRLGQPAKAMRCFLTALDLDPKDNNLIKAAMDRLDEPDVEDEVSVF
ncbi:hypothetical protein ACHAW5_011201 [Stephanodiscus triporus]|uniref:Uncharacterized protein n=1 Tax=Stephanodiscus triporus TaxID=2934178 RepID=A0ABD3PDF6_9STRA